MFPNY